MEIKKNVHENDKKFCQFVKRSECKSIKLKFYSCGENKHIQNNCPNLRNKRQTIIISQRERCDVLKQRWSEIQKYYLKDEISHHGENYQINVEQLCRKHRNNNRKNCSKKENKCEVINKIVRHVKISASSTTYPSRDVSVRKAQE